MHEAFGYASQQVVCQGIAVKKLIGVLGIRTSQPKSYQRAADTAQKRQLLRTKIERDCCAIFLLWKGVDRCSWGVCSFIDIPAAIHKPTRTSHTRLQFSMVTLDMA